MPPCYTITHFGLKIKGNFNVGMKCHNLTPPTSVVSTKDQPKHAELIVNVKLCSPTVTDTPQYIALFIKLL